MQTTSCKLALSAAFLLAHLSIGVSAATSMRSSNPLESLHDRNQNRMSQLRLADDRDIASIGDVGSETASTSTVPLSTRPKRRLASRTMDAKTTNNNSNAKAKTSMAASGASSSTNSTSGQSMNVTATTSSASNETAPPEDSPTETPTLTVEQMIALMDDDYIKNVTSVIPPEKEPPKGWAGEVIGMFILAALVLFAATVIKQCRKRRTYSEIPTSLVV